MRGHNICFIEEILKIIPVTPSYPESCIFFLAHNQQKCLIYTQQQKKRENFLFLN